MIRYYYKSLSIISFHQEKMKLFIIINYIDKNIFLDYCNYIILKRKGVIIKNNNLIKAFNIDNVFFSL